MIPSFGSHAVQLIQRDREVAHARSGRMMTALAIAAATPTIPISPSPLMPSGLESSRSSTKMTLMSCTSALERQRIRSFLDVFHTVDSLASEIEKPYLGQEALGVAWWSGVEGRGGATFSQS
jgi:hypothetical protein